jgi:hypothetical protein
MPFDRENDDQPTMLAQRIEWKTPFLDTQKNISGTCGCSSPQRDWYFTGFGTSPIADDCDFVRVMHGLNAAGFCPNQWYQCTDT